MKYFVIFVLFFIQLSDSNDFKCGRDRMESVEFYCSNFNETVPVDCVSALNITDKTNLTQLKVGGCNHDEVKQLIEMFVHLESLDISNSGIKSLDEFNWKQEHLTKLNASHNQLTEVPMKFLSQMPELVEIDLAYNELNKIAEFPDKLVKINLSHNKLSSIHRDDFVNLTELEYVDLSYNSIAKLDLFYIFPTNNMLKSLRLQKNPIKEFDYRFTPLLQRGVSVHISWKNITRFMFWNYDADKIRVICNSENEGVLQTNDGKLELHCNQMSFENIFNFQALSNQIENPTEMIHCLTSSLKFLELSGNFEEKFNISLLERFKNLNHLSLKGTQLLKFDLNVVKNYKKLTILQLPGNNLTKIDNLDVLKHFEYPISVDFSENQLENVPEILEHLTSKTIDLNLSGNFVGKLNATTFQRFIDMNRLILRNTSISFDNLTPFEPLEKLYELDISHNNLDSVNFTSASMTLKSLQILNVAHCKIRNITELIKLLGPSLWKLDLAGNFLGKLNADTFDNIKMGLKVFNMSNTHLTDPDIDAFKHLTRLENLDVSENKLKSFNFTSVSSQLHTLHLNGNDLKEIENFTKSYFPALRSLNISKNQFTCEFLAKFTPHLKKEWPHLMMFGDSWQQKHEDSCHPMDEHVIE